LLYTIFVGKKIYDFYTGKTAEEWIDRAWFLPVSYAATQLPDEISMHEYRAVASINWGNSEVIWQAPGSKEVLHRESIQTFSERTGKVWMPIAAFEEITGVPVRDFVRIDYDPDYFWIGYTDRPETGAYNDIFTWEDPQQGLGIFFAGATVKRGTFKNSTFIPIEHEDLAELYNRGIEGDLSGETTERYGWSGWGG